MLISNIKHNGNANEGNYVSQLRYRPEDDVWYEIQDLYVNKIMPQQVAISESYILVYEQLPPSDEEIKEPIIEALKTTVYSSVPIISHQNGDSDTPIITEEKPKNKNGLSDDEELIIT
jgi:hypothetical protein